MFEHQSRGTEEPFIETKLGIVTRKGEWFFISSEKIGEYVPGLLEVISLEELILEAQAWARSSAGLSITLLMGLLFLADPWIALAAALLFHGFWYSSKSAFVIRNMGVPLRVINSDGYQMVLSLVVLSTLANEGHYVALTVGLLYFFLSKLRLLDRLWRLIGLGEDSGLSLNDRVLKMLIIRYSMHENLAPRGVRQMDEKLQRMVFTRGRDKDSGES